MTVDLSSPQDVVDSKVLEGEEGIVTVSTLHVSTLARSQNSLHRSISEVMDKKTEEGGKEEWDPHKRWHDSGMVSWSDSPNSLLRPVQ